jgi:hypothetical protein
MFEPADEKFWEAVRQADPELFRSIKPWNKIVEPDPLRSLLVECGVSDPVVVAEPGTHPLNAPEDWWTIILGWGHRSTVDALSPANRERVRVTTIDAVRREKIREIRANVVYAIAQRSRAVEIIPQSKRKASKLDQLLGGGTLRTSSP